MLIQQIYWRSVWDTAMRSIEQRQETHRRQQADEAAAFERRMIKLAARNFRVSALLK